MILDGYRNDVVNGDNPIGIILNYFPDKDPAYLGPTPGNGEKAFANLTRQPCERFRIEAQIHTTGTAAQIERDGIGLPRLEIVNQVYGHADGLQTYDRRFGRFDRSPTS